MRDAVVRLAGSVHILDNVRIAQQELLAEEVLLLGWKWQLRDELSQVVEDEVLALRMKICIERAIHESYMDLVLNDVELSFIPFGGDFGEAIGQLCLADRNDSLVFEICAEGHLDESFIASYAEHEVVVVKLSLGQLATLLLVKQRPRGGEAPAILEEVKSYKDALTVVCEVWRL